MKMATARKLGCTEDAGAERFDDTDRVFRHPAPTVQPETRA